MERQRVKRAKLGANTAFQILFFLKVYKLEQFKHVVCLLVHNGDDDDTKRKPYFQKYTMKDV